MLVLRVAIWRDIKAVKAIGQPYQPTPAALVNPGGAHSPHPPRSTATGWLHWGAYRVAAILGGYLSIFPEHSKLST